MVTFNDRSRKIGDNTKTTAVQAKVAGEPLGFHDMVSLDPNDDDKVFIYNPMGTLPLHGYVLNTPNGNETGEVVSVQVNEVIEDQMQSSGPAVTLDKFVGSVFQAEPGRTETDGLIPLIDGYRITNGVAMYPQFALRWPSFTTIDPISGSADLLVPVGWNGAFTRNLGGNAAAFATSQADATAPNGLDVRYRRPSTPQPDGVGGNGNGVRFIAENIAATVTGDVETRPINVGLQYYLILDGF